MDPTRIRTFSAYGGAVDQRVYGPSKAAEYGAVAALVRSMTTAYDDFPHTGVTVYKDTLIRVPGLAISTNDAEKLSKALKKGRVNVFIKTNCKSVGLRPAPTVIGEIKGTEFPDEIILVGGHLDSWDIGQGAHDDGAGCVQSMEVLRVLQALDYKPKRTIRCVLFSNEENGLAGGKTYAKESNDLGEFHLAALESDAGGFSPRGFSFEADTSVFKTYYKNVSKWLPLLESYGLLFEMGGSGADISPLKSQKGLLIGLRPDSQRYFDFHHTANDRIEHVNKRELELGAAAMASLIFLIDKYGIK
jgi:Zn-dependent M28 family amino/carboxypeptidase